jgi:RNA polymerase sigma-70 factor (ECF subfamily)
MAANPRVTLPEVEQDFDEASRLARVRQGDEEAARALVQQLYPAIIRIVRGHLPRRTSEEDLAQAVFAKVFSKLDQFSGLVPLEHWVSRIAVNTCINQLNHEILRPELRLSDLSEEQQAVVGHLACDDADRPGERSSAARELLEKLMARLRPDERLVITLVHLEERSSEEISRLTGWSISQVKVKAFRARHKLRKIWDRLFKDKES